MRKLLTLTCIALLPVVSGCAAVAIGGAAATGVILAEDRRTVGTITEDQGIELKAASRIEEKVKAVREAISSDDVAKINAASTELESQLQALAAAAQQAGAGMGGNPDVEPAEESNESNEPKKAKGKVVDAEVVD